jgi:citrate lyase subunit beta/citryl-CoA lyase
MTTHGRVPPRREATGLRSWLFAPANHARRVEKVFAAGADVAILDLEDAVAPEEKGAARVAAAAALRQPRACLGYVRVNGTDTPWWADDLATVAGPGLDGVVVPKAEHLDDLRAIDAELARLERERGLPPGRIDLVPLVETAAGLSAVGTFGAVARASRVAFGGADYCADLDLVWTAEEDEFAYARARLVHGSRLAGLEPPVDTVVVQIREPERFRAAARRGRRFGFQGKLCIHPDQVPLANEAFGVSSDEVAHARRVLAAWAEAQARGLASIQLDGLFVDPPIAARARRVVAIAERDARRTAGG